MVYLPAHAGHLCADDCAVPVSAGLSFRHITQCQCVGHAGGHLRDCIAFVTSCDCSCSLLVVAIFRFKQLKLAILPLLLALVLLVATNVHGFQKFAVSPFGSVFFLARLAADGHINPVLKQRTAIIAPLHVAGSTAH